MAIKKPLIQYVIHSQWIILSLNTTGLLNMQFQSKTWKNAFAPLELCWHYSNVIDKELVCNNGGKWVCVKNELQDFSSTLGTSRVQQQHLKEKKADSQRELLRWFFDVFFVHCSPFQKGTHNFHACHQISEPPHACSKSCITSFI